MDLMREGGLGLGQSKKRQERQEIEYIEIKTMVNWFKVFFGDIGNKRSSCFDGEGWDIGEEFVDGVQLGLSYFGIVFLGC